MSHFTSFFPGYSQSCLDLVVEHRQLNTTLVFADTEKQHPKAHTELDQESRTRTRSNISQPYKQISESYPYANIAQKKKTRSPNISCNDLTKISSIKNATITHWILCMCTALRGSSWPMAYRCICRTYNASIVMMLIRFIATLYSVSGCAP